MRVNIVNPSLYVASFITFVGYYVVVMLVLYFGSEQMSRLLTVPTRLFATLLMVLIIFKRGFSLKDNYAPKLLFTIFSAIYLANVIVDFVLGGEIFASRSASQILMYYIVYALIPFYFFSQKKDEFDYEIIFKAIVLSGILLSLLSLILFGDILTEGYSRISVAKNDFDFSLISPLSLSYSASFLIGICLSGILFNKDIRIDRRYLFVGLLIGLVPFLLGASRGSVIGLVVPFVFVFMYKTEGKLKLNMLLIVGLFLIVAYWVAESVGSGVFNRTLSIDEDIQNDSSSAYRLYMWEIAFKQFLSSPVFGDSIHFEINNYPHNLLIESLMAVGIVGTFPLIFLLVLTARKSFLIIKYQKRYIWIVIGFWQGVISSMFSYSIYNNVFFYASLGLLVSVSLKNKE